VNHKHIIGVVAASLLAASVQAQKLYKVVDENGRVSYQDTLPDADSSTIQERHVDTNSNRLSTTAPRTPPAGEIEKALAAEDDEPSDSGLSGDSLSDGNPRQFRPPPPRGGDADALEDEDQISPPPGREDIVRIEENDDLVDDALEVLPDQSDPLEDPDGTAGNENTTETQSRPGRRGSSDSAIAESEIKILKGSESATKRPNSRGRRPAPKKQPAERLSTEELAEIARSLEEKSTSE